MDFETMIRRGLGRAVLYAREHDVSLHRDFLIHACLNNIAYDTQLSGDQSVFMFDIIHATGDLENYARGILDAMAQLENDYNTQVYEILRRTCEHGGEFVRPVLYEYITAELSQGDAASADVLVKLDGLPGFLYVLEHLEGKEIAEEDEWCIEDVFEALETKIGEEQAQSALDEAIAHHPTYARYAEIIRARRKPQKPRKSAKSAPGLQNYDQITEVVITGKQQMPPYTLTIWGKKADETTVLKIASDLLQETDEIRLAYYLRFFYKRAFPLAPDKLLALAESENQTIAWLARCALSHVTHPAVREMALRILRQPGAPTKAVALLAYNFQEGDWNIVTNTVLRELSVDDYHRVEMDVRDLFDEHPDPEAKDALLALYERGPCLICRYHIVEGLQVLGALPNWMIDECRYDAYIETRELAARLLAIESADTSS